MIQYIKNLKWNRWVQLVLALLIAAFSFIPWHSPLFIRSGISDFQYVIDAIKDHFNFFYFFFYILIPFIAYFIPISLRCEISVYNRLWLFRLSLSLRFCR